MYASLLIILQMKSHLLTATTCPSFHETSANILVPVPGVLMPALPSVAILSGYSNTFYHFKIPSHLCL
jgi:hypothetical protein